VNASPPNAPRGSLNQAADRGPAGTIGDPAHAPIAVVELFTSEGCSSCPPADDLLRQLAAEARTDGLRVFLLSFHVDYWNELGWTDPFSARAFTERQHAYSRAAGGSGVYTPQMIVGGRDAFVGSDAEHARSSIKRSLAQPALAAVSLKTHAPAGAASVEVTYTLAGAPSDAVLHVALIERDLVVRVPRGENAGRTLRHENVVRAIETARVGGAQEGSLKLPLPPSIDRSKASIIGYAQRRETLEIVGAASALIE
jgi:hypothetical protein